MTTYHSDGGITKMPDINEKKEVEVRITTTISNYTFTYTYTSSLLKSFGPIAFLLLESVKHPTLK